MPDLDPGHASSKGHLSLWGRHVDNVRRLDAFFRGLARRVDATEFEFSCLVPVAALSKADYFMSFPHLAALVSNVHPERIEPLRQSAEIGPMEAIPADCLGSAEYVLAPAACYSLYSHFESSRLTNAIYATLRAPCCRSEERYLPFQRQNVFNMREIVCLGGIEAVQEFIDLFRGLIQQKLDEAALPISYVPATDPFYDRRDPRRLLQRIDPVKHEFVYGGDCAIASINQHRNFFGEKFAIEDAVGQPIFSACVAFGIERWYYACMSEFGDDWEQWPAALRAEGR